MRLTRDEVLLVVAILTAITVGSAVKQYRDRMRENLPAVTTQPEPR